MMHNAHEARRFWLNLALLISLWGVAGAGVVFLVIKGMGY